MNIDPKALDRWRELRWRARTDTMYLARLLGYNALTETTHGPVIAHLQKFQTPTPEQAVACDRYVNGRWEYTPVTRKPATKGFDTCDDIYDLEGKRRMLLLDSRGFAKSTINCVCHTIQWIINYPNIAILIIQANLQKVNLVIDEIKSHFQYNEEFRALFPEHCPQRRIPDWGKVDRFTTLARKDKKRKEPTLLGVSIDTGVAGMHFHVMKFSDIVEQDNSETREQILKVISRFGMFRNLLDEPDGWIDVEGTRYDYSDLYGRIIEGEKERDKKGEEKQWKIFVRGCYIKDVDDPKYTLDELEMPHKLDARGRPISNWPERFPVDYLESERTDPAIPDSGLIFACQRLNNPMDVQDTRRPFPLDKFRYISRADFDKVPIAYRVVAVDTAETVGKKSDYTAITTGAWSKNGKLYIENVIHGKFLPEEIIFHLFQLMRTARAPSEQPRAIYIEETAYVRGLMAAINRAQDTQLLWIPEHLREKYGRSRSLDGIRLPLVPIRRETQISKQERIMNTLQPWYVAGDLIFLEDIPCLDYIRQELNKFPQYHTDDIADTLADLFQHKEWFGRLTPRPSHQQAMQQTLENFLGISDPYGPFSSHGAQEYDIPTPYLRTGGL